MKKQQQDLFNKKFAIIISGPTASGKTDLSNIFADYFEIEIINADVGQFYKPLSVGTAKPDLTNPKVLHHLFDILDKPEDLTIFQYKKLVQEHLELIWSKNKIPVIVGGSLFYIKSLFFISKEFESKKIDQDIYFKNILDQDLWNLLNSIDPERAALIHHNDIYRLKRALSIWYSTGIKPSKAGPLYEPFFNSIFVYVDLPKSILDQRIDKRTDIMINNMGFIEEAKKIINTDWENFLIKKNLIGYPEIFDWIKNGSDQSKIFNLIKDIACKTKQYAKKQRTFWKSFEKQLIEHRNNKYTSEIFILKDLEFDSFQKIFVAVNRLLG